MFPMWIDMSGLYKKAGLLLLLSLALLLGLPDLCTAAPASSGVDIAISSGFDGRCKLGGFNPVLVELYAGNGGCKGELQLKSGEIILKSPVELAAGAKKIIRFSIPLFRPDQRLEALFSSPGGSGSRAEHQPQILPEKTLFIGILGDSPGELDYLKDMDTSGLGGGGVEVVNLREKLDYSLEELENINFIFLEDFNTAALDQSGSRLLAEWVKLGNCLLAGAGDHRGKNLAGLLSGIHSPTFLGEGVVVPVEGGLAGKAPEAAMAVLVKQLTPHAAAKALRGGGLQQRAAGAARLSGAAEGELLPGKSSLYFSFSLLLLYLLVILAAILAGQKIKWAYAAAVSSFSLLFLGLSLYSGIFGPAAGGAAVRLHGDMAVTHALNCVYSGEGGEGSLKIPGASFAWALGSGWNSDALCSGVSYTGGEGRYIYTCSYGPGTTGDNALTLDGDGAVSGEIVNPLASAMESCFLLVGDTAIPVGSLEGRERFSVDYRLDHNLGGSGDYNYLDLLYRAAGLGDSRRQLLDYYFYNLEDDRPGGRLIGFSREKAAAEINGDVENMDLLVLNVFPVGFNSGEGLLNLPPEWIKPVVDCGPAAENEFRREYAPGTGGELKMHYILPAGLKPREISLTGPSPGEAGDVMAYNRKTGAWEKLPGTTLAGEKLLDCVSSGPLALKIAPGSSILIPQLAVKGSEER